MWNGRLLVTGGLRYDRFRFRVDALGENASRWQPKASLAFTPSHRLPATFHMNYGRGISTVEFKGPSRAYGYETKLTFDLTRRVSISGRVTKVANTFYRRSSPRVCVESAPHFTANTALTVAAWKGWSGSSRLPGQEPRARIHATPEYPLTAMVGLTVGLSGK